MATDNTFMQFDPTVPLDAAFYASRRTMFWRRRPVSPGLQMLLWSLRLYVVLMLAVVVIELARVLK
ncbi:hypothetical protein [Acidiphilium sp. PM]|uniref:hypothetical protein n=1 Tax=Acidiphilium sp. PM TaxID=1043206 RepID=UPI000586633B|nr:hypothetical protein [Acidiphilium sp. PM]